MSLGVMALAASLQVFREQVAAVTPAPEQDLAAIAVRSMVPSEIDDGVVFAKIEDGRSYRAMFQLYSLSKRMILDQPTLSKADIPPGRKWVLLLDTYGLDLRYYSRVQGKGFQFIQLSPGGIVVDAGARLGTSPRIYDLSNRGERAVFMLGFGAAEEWGVWSVEPVARIYFDAPISGKVSLMIKGRAYGPNDQRLIKVKLGDTEREIKFSRAIDEVHISANLAQPVAYIEFSGMLGVSPAELEKTSDRRPLGIGLSEIAINRSQ
jgi:hypothetical protein